MDDRKKWLKLMLTIASPVLKNLSAGSLTASLPKDFHVDRNPFAPLEAFGRTVCGIAPWLELEGLTGEEAALQAETRALTLKCVEKAVDPQSPDYMNFGKLGSQPLVDGAFLAHAFVRSPKFLAGSLRPETKANLIKAFKQTRKIINTANNWLFFSAMIEAALYLLGEDDYDLMRVDYAFKMFEKWYAGDGLYADGERFHWDYYNSFVIHPMMLDILDLLGDHLSGPEGWQDVLHKRSARYAAILERHIAPDGSFPVIGRSITYRFGAFQLLSQAALSGFLPENVAPSAVRCALSAVIERVAAFDETFDENGWLRPGLCGYQPELAEEYISSGSLYLCTAVFVALGLPPSDPFWAGEDEEWTSKKIWSGKRTAIDHAIHF